MKNKILIKLKNIFYISLPEKIQVTANEFTLNPSILLPLESGLDGIQETIKNLSWEMIIAAILKVLLHNPKHKDIEYYQSLVFAVRPQIIEELTNAAFAKITLKDYDFAEEILTSLTILSPKNDACKLNLALIFDDRCILYKENKNEVQNQIYFEKAKKLYGEIMKSPTPVLQAYYYAALFFARSEENDRAIQYLNHFIQFSDDETKIENAKKIIGIIEKEN